MEGVAMKEVYVEYVGVDHFCRPVFKDTNSNSHYGSVTTLFDWGTPKEEVLKNIHPVDLAYFGEKFGCEPQGGMDPDIKLIIIKATQKFNYAEFGRFKQMLEKALDEGEESFEFGGEIYKVTFATYLVRFLDKMFN